MKRTIFFIVCYLFTMVAHAQFQDAQKGDIITINNVKALVFMVDGEGHGTAVAVKALRGKKNVWCTNSKFVDQVSTLSKTDGMANTLSVYEFVENNRAANLSDFPAFEWCKSLGEGWYIPSYKELEVLVNFYLGNDVEYDWDSMDELEISSESISTKQINESLIEAGGHPLMANTLAAAAVGVCTSTSTEGKKVYVYQYLVSKNQYRFKPMLVSLLDLGVSCRAFYNF